MRPLRTNYADGVDSWHDADANATNAEVNASTYTGVTTSVANELAADGKNTVNTKLGEWLVLDGDLRAISCNDFDELYTSDPVEFPMQISTPAEEGVVDETPFGSQTSENLSTRMTGGSP